jgi:hypothetical protein
MKKRMFFERVPRAKPELTIEPRSVLVGTPIAISIPIIGVKPWPVLE